MQLDGKAKLKKIERAIDKCLTTLDHLRQQTDEKEQCVMRLMQEQRLLHEKIN